MEPSHREVTPSPVKWPTKTSSSFHLKRGKQNLCKDPRNVVCKRDSHWELRRGISSEILGGQRYKNKGKAQPGAGGVHTHTFLLSLQLPSISEY